MISLAQIKAARALLGWSQDALAKASGLSLPAINNIERGLASPRKDTMAAIEGALSAAGVDFLDISGVQLRRPDVETEIIDGPDWLERYDADIFSVLKSETDEIVQWSCDERHWMTYGGTTNHLYMDHLAKIGFKQRLLVPETIDYITNDPGVYRTLPSDAFDRTATQVYGDRVAHIIWPSRKIVLIRSPHLAAGLHAQFELLWDQAKPLTKDQLKTIEQWTSD